MRKYYTNKELDYLIVLAQKKLPGLSFRQLQDRANLRIEEFHMTEGSPMYIAFSFLAKRLGERAEKEEAGK